VRHILAILVAVLTFCQSPVFAETKEIVAEGAYNMGDGETPTVAESRALLQAKRTAVEEAGTYVESYSKTRNFQLTVDEIQVLASGVMEVEVLEKKRTVVGDGFNFWIKIKARVSTDKMEEMAKRVKEKSVVDDYKKIQEAYDKSQKGIEELKGQLSAAKNATDKKKIETRITDDERLFQANVWLEIGNMHLINVWFERGNKHLIKKEFDAAIEAYTNAIALNPNLAYAYSFRGFAYRGNSQYDRAILDYNKALEANPNDAEAYLSRGASYAGKGQFDMAILDYNKALEANPNYAEAYNKRGLAYANKDQYEKAVLDHNKALEIDPNHSKTYLYRGNVYTLCGQYERAIIDFNKALEIEPDDTDPYIKRGATYILLGQYERANYDFQKACNMGSEAGCSALQVLKK